MKTEYEAKQKYITMNFTDLSDNRILIKKQDKSAFTEENYKDIDKIDNIDYIVKNDWFIDNKLLLYKGKSITTSSLFKNQYAFNIAINGTVSDILKFEGKIDVGRMPEDKNEVIIKVSGDNTDIKNKLSQIVDNQFEVSAFSFKGEKDNKYEYEDDLRVTIVGIQYIGKEEKTEIYVDSALLNDLITQINGRYYSKLSYLFEGNYISNNFRVVPSKNVPKGFAIVNKDMKMQLNRGNIKDKKINIYVHNIYYEDEIELKIKDTYTEKNFTELTDYEKYDNLICINIEDYRKLFKKPFYQSSIYVKNTNKIDNTIQVLENIGVKAKKVSDYRVINNEMNKQIQLLKIVKLTVTITLILTLFFISYFIIKIILKSRNKYYSTLRMLGVKYKSLKKIVHIELFINSSIAYIITIVIIQVIKIDIIHLDYILKLVSFLSINEYLLAYLVVILMTSLLTRKVSKNIFEDTIINSYDKEI